MRLSSLTVQIICLILAGVLLFSCACYSYYEVPKAPPPSFEGRYLIVFFPEKPGVGYIYSDLSISEQQLTGRLNQLNYLPNLKDRNTIIAFLKPGLPLPDSLVTEYRLPLADINRMEVYDLNLGKTVLASTAALAGIGIGAGLILYIIILLTKESCPFIYCYNGEDFEFTGEIYGGAIFPNLERDDYLPLPTLQPKDGLYQLRMDNLAEEIQFTNLAELSVVDHPLGSSLFVDRKGNYYTVREPVLPVSAVSGTHENVLELLKAKDDAKYMGDDSADQDSPFDALELQFELPSLPQNAKLILKARNSIWLDKTLGQFLDMFGSRYDRWYARQAKPDKSLDPDWALKQGIPLSVYLKQDGKWKFVDHFPVVGPMADRDLIMPLDLTELKGDKLELRLQCGAKFWEIDYAALDFSAPERIIPQKLSLQIATTTEGKDVTKLLTQTDKKYFVQPKVGDSALLQYAAPPSREGMSRTVFLHSRGHYKVIRKAKGEPDVTRLEQFRQPGSFALFSRRNYLEFLAKYSLGKQIKYAE